MEKFIVIYGAGGYDGDDNYCFGNTDVVGLANNRAEAERIAREQAKELANEFMPENPTEDEMPYGCDSLEEYNKQRIEALDIEEERNEDGELLDIIITHDDDMFPHFACIRVTKITV